MTGRENIYMNGAILGMTKHEISKKLDEIIDFSGCERYIDTPVKRYSSGMMVRLGFAVAAHLDPEILVVDEVLAVGDAEFQKKAIGKMQDVSKGEGRTVLFVSHNMGSIRQLCRNAIVLEKGRIIHQSEAHSAVDFYLGRNIEDKRSAQVIVSDEQHDKNRSLDVKFLSFTFAKEDPTFASDEDIDIEIKVTASSSKECRINCTIFNVEGTPVGSYTSMDTFQIEAGERKTLLYTIQNTRLAMGTYTISFSIGSGDASQGETNYDVVQQIIGFEIDKISRSGDSYYAKWDRGWGNIFLNTKTVEK
jgi:lipopolysaccharide transport system ATP-binding protein